MPQETCVVILIQLGCDIIEEIRPIAESVRDVVLELQEKARVLISPNWISYPFSPFY